MAPVSISPQQIEQVRELTKGWGQVICRRLFGEDGPGLDVNLSAMEQLAVHAMQGLAEGILQTATQQQAQQRGPQQACPDCDQPCPVTHEPRLITTRGGPFLYHEPVCHCPRCRRDFFPSASCFATRGPRLQPGHAQQDRADGRPGQVL